MKRPIVHALPVFIEALEDRRMLAGSVVANVVGTSLRIEADAATNDYVISGAWGTLQLTSGADATAITVNGNLSAVNRITINDLGGDDVVTIRGVESMSSISVRTTEGQKQITVDESTIGRLSVTFNDGTNLNLDLNDSTIERTIALVANQASLTTVMTGDTKVGGTVMSRVVGGNHHVSMSDTSSARIFRQTTSGGGDSSTTIADQARVANLVSVRNIEGRSDVRIVDDATIGRFVGSGLSVKRNIEYVNREGRALRADIYAPRSEGPHPAVIAIHGGFWRSGNKGSMGSEARNLAQRGYVVMSVEYRLAPDNPFPEQIHDVKAAISWLKANAAQYKVDPDNIGLWGFSAGAQLALLAGLTAAHDGLEDPAAPGGSPSTLVQAVVASAPPTDFRDADPDSEQFAYLFGGTRAEVPDLYAQASPANYVSTWDPPVYMYMGENDNVVSQAKAEQLADDLNDAGVEAELHIVPKKNHVTARRDRTAVYQSLRFLDQQLK